MRRTTTYKLAATALMAALCYIGFAYLRFDFALPGGGSTAIHFGNAFCVLAALLLGGPWGGVAGGFGMALADITVPAYVLYAPRTLVMKFCIGLVVGLVAHRIGHIREKSAGSAARWSALAAAAGMLFNLIVDPIGSYLYSKFIFGAQPELATIMASWTAGTTAVNAVTAVAIAVALYNALRPALNRAGLLQR